MTRLSVLAVLAALLAPAPLARAAAPPVRIVAAENFYGDIARQIGGPRVVVRSILDNPFQDPHLFEVSPSVGRDVANARLVILNGLGYDPWMGQLLRGVPAAGREEIVVADLVGRQPGANPHIWYDPGTMLALAARLERRLAAADPAHAAGERRRLATFVASMQPLLARIAALRRRLGGVAVTATEPVAGYLLRALGLKVRNRGFQLAVMNDTEPSVREVAAFERDLRTRRVKLLIYNRQASDPIAARMRAIARAAGVPVVGVSETEPPGEDYQRWMAGVLAAIARALGAAG